MVAFKSFRESSWDPLLPFMLMWARRVYGKTLVVSRSICWARTDWGVQDSEWRNSHHRLNYSIRYWYSACLTQAVFSNLGFSTYILVLCLLVLNFLISTLSHTRMDSFDVVGLSTLLSLCSAFLFLISRLVLSHINTHGLVLVELPGLALVWFIQKIY